MTMKTRKNKQTQNKPKPTEGRRTTKRQMANTESRGMRQRQEAWHDKRTNEHVMNTGKKRGDKADTQTMEQGTWHEKRARNAMTIETRKSRQTKTKATGRRRQGSTEYEEHREHLSYSMT